MSATATSRPSPSSPWSPGPQAHPHASVSTTPAGLPVRTPAAVVPYPSPFLNTNICSPQSVPGPTTSSPNYFCIEIENSSNPPDSNPGPYTKRNWDSLLHPQSSIPSPRPQPVSSNPGLEEYVRSRKIGLKALDKGYTDAASVVQPNPALNDETRRLEPHREYDSPVLPRSDQLPVDVSDPSRMDITTEHFLQRKTGEDDRNIPVSSDFFELGRLHSSSSFRSPSYPNLVSPHLSQVGECDPRLSEPLHIARHSISASGFPFPRRAETLPASLDHGNVNLASVERCAELLESFPDETLLLDVRPYPHYSQGNIEGSLNLCIPTTLLKRPSFNTQKLEDTFTGEDQKRKFARWKECTRIIVYDANTSHMKDAGPLLNVLRKFSADGWTGEALVLRGGFAAFSNRFPDRVRRPQQRQLAGTFSKQPLSMNLSLPSVAPVVGGCALPESSSAANPFFGNIRQNMDLVGGVGQMVVKLPEGLTESKRNLLPCWLRDASDSRDEGYTVSETFLKIEKMELERMREALSSKVSYGPLVSDTPAEGFRVAGIEKGSKNRYNDIYPFDHSRVRLQNVPTGGCDYVNANHVKAEYTNKSYIATQAPVPDTFNDFWRVVWEQDVRVIVALTAEIERGQIKCHPYWHSGDYGPLKLKTLAERRVSINSTNSQQDPSLHRRPSSGQRRSTNPLNCTERTMAVEASESAGGDPHIVVRHFTLSHSAFPFQPLREVTQLQYPYWPDFGTTSQPAHLLRLIEQCDKVTRSTGNSNINHSDAEPEGQPPVLVHCSAGCGRTGTFCTVDSVLDTLKRQRAGGAIPLQAGQIPGGRDGWIHNEDVDLVAKTVEDFRTQRPSMVQNLGQFVLCYESVLEWFVSQMGESDFPGREEVRRSYQG